ncbi:alpha/beta hydrolase family protein [Phenylobacterium montanum]|uniref:Alpha/beta hydrolase n=1 Tax=Phenylobacterium montanum TaxID=2823693 RepID=A0A975FX30_9CAUL|nr:alpha/beta hydrolase [Caulobacter sp. S6]QUD86527.1 alpha/beta hydrolase [Caulobacter sp. S6]
MKNRAALIAAVLLAALAPAVALADSDKTTVGDCHIGAYRLADGSLVDIGASTGQALRWRRFDGTTGALTQGADGVWGSTRGWTGKPDGHQVRFGACGTGELSFDGQAAHRQDFDVTDTTFQGAGVKLAGRLVLPKGAGRVPVVVLIHGSENYSARDLYSLQRILPAEGVGVFVYDKRGIGASEGKYTQDFETLADDAVAAMGEARRLAGPRAGRMGFQGGSQGGWIAPLAATKTRADFVISSFGLLISPLEEDREEAALELKLKGHSQAEIDQAMDVVDAVGVYVSSDLKTGYDRLDALRTKDKAEPWYKDLHGNFTWMVLPLSDAEAKAKASELVMGTPWRYDGMDVERRLNTPQLWIQGSDDLQAPYAETRRRLDALAAAGKPITRAVFPHTEHGIYEYELDASGERQSTRNADGYFAMMRDFARDGRLNGTYGDGTVTTPKRAMAASGQ